MLKRHTPWTQAFKRTPASLRTRNDNWFSWRQKLSSCRFVQQLLEDGSRGEGGELRRSLLGRVVAERSRLEVRVTGLVEALLKAAELGLRPSLALQQPKETPNDCPHRHEAAVGQPER